MLMFRNVDGFSLLGKTHYVRVKFVIIDGARHAAIYESGEPYPDYIQPLNDRDLYRFAYRYASMCARYEYHSHE